MDILLSMKCGKFCSIHVLCIAHGAVMEPDKTTNRVSFFY